MVIILVIAGAISNYSSEKMNDKYKEIWNDGICPKCETVYQLGGVYRGIKYYQCPTCGNEAERW